MSEYSSLRAQRAAETAVRTKATRWGDMEAERWGEYLRLVAAGTKPFEAWAMTEAQYAAHVIEARAEYEIAVAALRRS